MNTSVAAVVTTYDRPSLCKRAIRSVKSQSNKLDEIIVVEDGSDTDLRSWIDRETEEIDYYCHPDNRGLPSARNTGIRESESSFIAFLDDDDWWHEDKIDRQLNLVQSLSEKQFSELAVVQTGIEVNDSDGDPFETVIPHTEGNLRESIIRDGLSTASSSYLFRRSPLESVNGFSEDLLSHIDHDIFLKLAQSGFSGEVVKHPLVYTDVRSNRNTMMSNNSDRIEGTDQLIQKWRPVIRGWMGTDDGDKFLREYCLRVLANLTVRNILQGDVSGFFQSTKAVITRSGISLRTLRYLLYQIVRQLIRYKAPEPTKKLLTVLGRTIVQSN